MTEPDRFAVVEALRKVVADQGWQAEVTEFHSWQMTIVVRPPLAKPNSERNRWPDEPEEGEEPTQVERERQEIIEHVARVADIDIGVDTPFLGAERAD